MKTLFTVLVTLCTLNAFAGGTLNIQFPNSEIYLVIVNGQPHFGESSITFSQPNTDLLAISILSYQLDLASQTVSTTLITEKVLCLSNNESKYLHLSNYELVSTGSGTSYPLFADADADADKNIYIQQEHGYYCGQPRAMNKEAFSSFRSYVASKRFDSSMLDAIKEAIHKPMLTGAQLKSLMQLFAFDTGKVELAKFGYNKLVDPENFVIVYDVFRFSSSADELRSYLRK